MCFSCLKKKRISKMLIRSVLFVGFDYAVKVLFLVDN